MPQIPQKTLVHCKAGLQGFEPYLNPILCSLKGGFDLDQNMKVDFSVTEPLVLRHRSLEDLDEALPEEFVVHIELFYDIVSISCKL